MSLPTLDTNLSQGRCLSHIGTEHEPRFTRDIDLLVDSEDYEKTKGILEKDEYFESASPWTFPNVAVELHRFLKIANEEDEMLIDILVAKSEEVRMIIRNAVEAESEEGV